MLQKILNEQDKKENSNSPLTNSKGDSSNLINSFSPSPKRRDNSPFKRYTLTKLSLFSPTSILNSPTKSPNFEVQGLSPGKRHMDPTLAK